ncbi:Hypothetical_protein [Hexamita inflata]|uniref:Hypothetical_protein n=1 Tax=Hexamita inflata TaxID=28002 RepID=A0AA86V110_9EUKA|nr:Hypothetical protein HINF_LOCUS64004 [Hexamita inflata]
MSLEVTQKYQQQLEYIKSMINELKYNVTLNTSQAVLNKDLQQLLENNVSCLISEENVKLYQQIARIDGVNHDDVDELIKLPESGDLKQVVEEIQNKRQVLEKLKQDSTIANVLATFNKDLHNLFLYDQSSLISDENLDRLKQYSHPQTQVLKNIIGMIPKIDPEIAVEQVKNYIEMGQILALQTCQQAKALKAFLIRNNSNIDVMQVNLDFATSVQTQLNLTTSENVASQKIKNDLFDQFLSANSTQDNIQSQINDIESRLQESSSVVDMLNKQMHSSSSQSSLQKVQQMQAQIEAYDRILAQNNIQGDVKDKVLQLNNDLQTGSINLATLEKIKAITKLSDADEIVQHIDLATTKLEKVQRLLSSVSDSNDFDQQLKQLEPMSQYYQLLYNFCKQHIDKYLLNSIVELEQLNAVNQDLQNEITLGTCMEVLNKDLQQLLENNVSCLISEENVKLYQQIARIDGVNHDDVDELIKLPESGDLKQVVEEIQNKRQVLEKLKQDSTIANVLATFNKDLHNLFLYDQSSLISDENLDRLKQYSHPQTQVLKNIIGMIPKIDPEIAVEQVKNYIEMGQILALQTCQQAKALKAFLIRNNSNIDVMQVNLDFATSVQTQLNLTTSENVASQKIKNDLFDQFLSANSTQDNIQSQINDIESRLQESSSVVDMLNKQMHSSSSQSSLQKVQQMQAQIEAYDRILAQNNIQGDVKDKVLQLNNDLQTGSINLATLEKIKAITKLSDADEIVQHIDLATTKLEKVQRLLSSVSDSNDFDQQLKQLEPMSQYYQLLYNFCKQHIDKYLLNSIVELEQLNAVNQDLQNEITLGTCMEVLNKDLQQLLENNVSCLISEENVKLYQQIARIDGVNHDDVDELIKLPESGDLKQVVEEIQNKRQVLEKLKQDSTIANVLATFNKDLHNLFLYDQSSLISDENLDRLKQYSHPQTQVLKNIIGMIPKIDPEIAVEQVKNYIEMGQILALQTCQQAKALKAFLIRNNSNIDVMQVNLDFATSVQTQLNLTTSENVASQKIKNDLFDQFLSANSTQDNIQSQINDIESRLQESSSVVDMLNKQMHSSSSQSSLQKVQQMQAQIEAYDRILAQNNIQGDVKDKVLQLNNDLQTGSINLATLEKIKAITKLSDADEIVQHIDLATTKLEKVQRLLNKACFNTRFDKQLSQLSKLISNHHDLLAVSYSSSTELYKVRQQLLQLKQQFEQQQMDLRVFEHIVDSQQQLDKRRLAQIELLQQKIKNDPNSEYYMLKLVKKHLLLISEYYGISTGKVDIEYLFKEIYNNIIQKQAEFDEKLHNSTQQIQKQAQQLVLKNKQLTQFQEDQHTTKLETESLFNQFNQLDKYRLSALIRSI